MASADYKVELVTDSGEADFTVAVVGQQVISMAGASPGDVLTVQPDGLTVAPEPAGAPGAHAASHQVGGTDPLSIFVASDGSLGLGGAPAAFVSLDVTGAYPVTGTAAYGVVVEATAPASVTGAGGEVKAFYAAVKVSPGVSLPSVAGGGVGYVADAPTLGAGASINTLIGFQAQNQGKTGVTNAYGIDVVAQSGAATLNIAARLSGGTQANLWLNSDVASAAGGIAFGTARDVEVFRNAAGGLTVNAALTVGSTNSLTVGGKIWPGDPEGFPQTDAGLWGGIGPPDPAGGADGDFYFRADDTAGISIYRRRGGSWDAIVTGAAAGMSNLTAARFLGVLNHTGPPVGADGTFAVGDVVFDTTGQEWLNTVAGSPGTWLAVGSGRVLAQATLSSSFTMTTAATPEDVPGYAVTFTFDGRPVIVRSTPMLISQDQASVKLVTVTLMRSTDDAVVAKMIYSAGASGALDSHVIESRPMTAWPSDSAAFVVGTAYTVKANITSGSSSKATIAATTQACTLYAITA